MRVRSAIYTPFEHQFQTHPPRHTETDYTSVKYTKTIIHRFVGAEFFQYLTTTIRTTHLRWFHYESSLAKNCETTEIM
jgi:hypothetical protein